jgi:hypothetical protein
MFLYPRAKAARLSKIKAGKHTNQHIQLLSFLAVWLEPSLGELEHYNYPLKPSNDKQTEGRL